MKRFISSLLIIALLSFASPFVLADTSQDKARAISQLNWVFSLYDPDDFSDQNWSLMQDAYASGIQAINSATTTENVYNNLNSAAETFISIMSKRNTVDVCLVIDKLNLNKGFLLPPTKLKVRKYTPASQVLADYFDEKYHNIVSTPIYYTGDIDKNFELTGVYENLEIDYDGSMEIELPNFYDDYFGDVISEKTINSPLKAGDYTQESCFVFSINNKYPHIKASGIPVVDEDVIRWQFSIYGKGADVGSTTYYSEPQISTFADKSEAFWLLADIYQKYDIEQLLTDENNAYNYKEAMKAILIPNISQNAVNKAVKKLEAITPVLVAPPEEIPEEDNQESTAQTFTDVYDTYFAKEAIYFLSSKNIVNGFPDGSFGINKNLTRAEFATMLSRIEGFDEAQELPFKDVNPDDWYYQGVAFCYSANITNGQTNDTFNPHSKITRQDLATMIYRYLIYTNKELENAENAVFEDISDCSLYAVKPIKALKQAGIINGFEGNLFKPQNNATRGEAAKILYNIFQ